MILYIILKCHSFYHYLFNFLTALSSPLLKNKNKLISTKSTPFLTEHIQRSPGGKDEVGWWYFF